MIYHMKIKLYHRNNNIYKKALGSTNPPIYPNEMLVKICSSKNYSNLTRNLFIKKIKVCEIGCLAGNNLRFFSERGYEVYGIEINKFLVNLCNKFLRKFKLKNYPKLLVGNNINIPIKKNSIDLMVSINTIHYSVKEEIDAALKNFKNILKKNGIAIIETPAPKHIIFKNSKKIENLKYKFKLPSSDHRNGIDIGLFDNKSQFKKKLKKHFKLVEICRRTEVYNDKTYDFFVAICKN